MCAAADRIERETARMNLTQMASASVKIIFDTVSGWRQAGHPMREFEIMRSKPKDSTCRMEHRNAGFRPDWSVASKPQLQGACRAVLDRAAKKSPAGAGPKIRGFFQQYGSSVSSRCGTSMAD
jgi:hypothetical protein